MLIKQLTGFGETREFKIDIQSTLGIRGVVVIRDFNFSRTRKQGKAVTYEKNLISLF